MKTDDHFSYCYLCPKTGKVLSEGQRAHSQGVCPHCGHAAHGTFTHAQKQAGKWTRPTLWERWKGLRAYFTPTPGQETSDDQ